jgi:hypothetical protein
MASIIRRITRVSGAAIRDLRSVCRQTTRLRSDIKRVLLDLIR